MGLFRDQPVRRKRVQLLDNLVVHRPPGWSAVIALLLASAVLICVLPFVIVVRDTVKTRGVLMFEDGALQSATGKLVARRPTLVRISADRPYLDGVDRRALVSCHETGRVGEVRIGAVLELGIRGAVKVRNGNSVQLNVDPALSPSGVLEGRVTRIDDVPATDFFVSGVTQRRRPAAIVEACMNLEPVPESVRKLLYGLPVSGSILLGKVNIIQIMMNHFFELY